MRPLHALVSTMALGSVMMLSGGTVLNAMDDIDLNRAWAERAFSAGILPGDVRVNRVAVIHEDVAGDTKIGTCAAVEAPPLRLGERTYVHGIGVNSVSSILVSLSKPAARFRATIGLDRNVDNTPASVRFHVRASGKDLYATEVIRANAPPRDIDVPLDGAMEFNLDVDDGGDGRGWDQADWADARVRFEDGTVAWLDDMARETHLIPGLPFSFRYAGHPSSEFLHAWDRQETRQAIGDGVTLTTLVLTDPDTGLQVRSECRTFSDTPGNDWTLYFTQTGARDTPLIEDIRPLDLSVAVGFGTPVVLHRLNGAPSKVDDWLPFDEVLMPGERREIATTNGRSANVSPFYTLDWGTGGAITAIGWSGQWTTSLSRDDGSLRSRAGMANVHLVLHPGETIRSPRILQVLWSGDDPFTGYNRFRETMRRHIIPKANGVPVEPPVAHMSTSFYELNRTDESSVLSHLASTRGLGFELFWLDAYWTGPDGFPNSMGNYGLPLETVEPQDRFPHGLAAIGEAVREAGLAFLMWFEPERVAPGTRIAREHPEWVLSPAGDGSGLFNLGNDEAREYMTEYLDAAIKGYKLSWLRIDYNIDPLAYWQHGDASEPDRVGMTEIRYVQGLYRMWDELLARNPALRIDNCASGGRRADLEACSRALLLWRSDNTCDMVGDDPQVILMAAIKNQVMSAGLNRYLPYSVVGQMGTDPYRFRSGFNGGIDFAQDVRPADFPRGQLEQAIAEGKRLRKYWRGDFYTLSDVTLDPRDWCVLQYHLPQSDAGIVVAFRRHLSPYSGYDCHLRGIDPEATYRVTPAQTYEPGEPMDMPGGALKDMRLLIDGMPGSLVLEYRKLAD